MGSDEDEVWRAIVDNYGDRAALDPDPAVDTGTDPGLDSDFDSASDLGAEAEPDLGPEPHLAPGPPPPSSQPSAWSEEYVDADWTTDRFVPPPPPPVPQTTPDRMAAWAGVFGSPLILLTCLIFGFGVPQLIAYLLVIGFVGGFVYLVIQMPREPRDPDDNGAVL